MIGETVGSYTVTEKISTGGMGTVYKAEHALIGKPAAVKVLHPELCHNKEIINRFFNEAKATTQIKHPGIVEIFDFGYMESGDAFIVMEFLEGVSLAKRLEDLGKMQEGEAAIILRSVCNALAAAHDKKIVHRDLKPDNIYLVADPEAPTGERPKILDFGIAKLSDVSLQGPTSVTKTGAVMGTPTYMSPEQCKGSGNIDERSDFYSLGCIFYELVTGRTPYTDMTAGELIGAHLYIEPVKPSVVEPSISAQAEQLIMDLLAKDPAKRPQTARDLALRFAEIAKNHGWVSQTNPTALRAPVQPKLSARLETGGETAPTLASDSQPEITRPAKPGPMPTTLSGAASQSQAHDIPRRRTGMFIALGGAVLAMGAVAFLAVNKLGSKHAATPAAKPAPVEAAPTPVEVAKPTPVPAVVPPTPPPPAVTPSLATPPVPTPPVEAVRPPPPVETAKPTRPTKPATTAAIKKPTTTATKPTKPATETKPATKPGTGQGSGKILIETDL